jgi:hypothetical protein
MEHTKKNRMDAKYGVYNTHHKLHLTNIKM